MSTTQRVEPDNVHLAAAAAAAGLISFSLTGYTIKLAVASGDSVMVVVVVVAVVAGSCLL